MIHEEGRSACIGICFGHLNVEVFFLNLQELKFWNYIRTRSGREEEVNKM
jgi:hypothetical protein